MRTWWMSGRTVVIGAVAAAAGVVAWLVGPAVTMAVAVAAGVAGGLLLAAWLRLRARSFGTELAALRRTAASRADLDGLSASVAAALRTELAGVEQRLSAAHDLQLQALERRRNLAGKHDFAQLQALQNLYAMIPVRHRMPPARAGWSVSPDLLLLLVSLLRDHRPETVIDLGSGVSTVWMAMALREFGMDGRIISVDHDPRYGEKTGESLASLGLAKTAEVRPAPLVDLELEGEVYPWYDRAAFADVTSCDLVLVDGPPGVLRSRSRYPALPVLAPLLAPGSRVVVDDYGRKDEEGMVADWLARYPGWSLRTFPFEKGAALLTRSAPGTAAG